MDAGDLGLPGVRTLYAKKQVSNRMTISRKVEI